MQFIDRFNRALEYIEQNLDAVIDNTELEKITCMSKAQFNRFFSAITEMSLSDYIRSRKLSQAAQDLRNSSLKIIDIANKYGYDSSAAFSRAFKNFHLISPYEAKTKNSSVFNIPPLKLEFNLKGGSKMKYYLKETEPFYLIGKSIPISDSFDENKNIIPEFWNESHRNGLINELVPQIDYEPQGIIGANTLEGGKYKYYIAVASDKDNENYDKFLVPKTTWAVFTGRGTTQDIQNLYKEVFEEWLPTSNYEYGGAVDLEVYKNANPMDMDFELWISVINKED